MESELLFTILFLILFLTSSIVRGIYARKMPSLKLSRRERMCVTIEHEGKAALAFLSIQAIILLSGFVLYVFFPYLIPWAQLTPWAVIAYPFIPGLTEMLYWMRWFGVVLGFVSLPFLVWVQHVLGRQWSVSLEIQEEHVLVTTGPYSRVRHPMYTVHIFFFLSWVLVTDNWFFLVNYFMTLALIGLRMPKEEKMMVDQFGDEYRAYMARTGQLFPRLRGPAAQEPEAEPLPELDKYGVNSIARSFSMVVIEGIILFLVAGRLDWWNAWFFVMWGLLFTFYFVLALLHWNPGLLNRRGKRRGEMRSPKTKRYDKVFLYLYTIFFLVVPAACALDAGRFLWSVMPLLVVGAGFLLVVLGDVIFGWAMVVNKFFEPTVRIQTDRGHQVVATGPYRFVRHPGYLGQILRYIGMPLVLGSLLGLVVGMILVAAFIGRTAKEDHTLRREFPGYEEYTERVRKRLIPLIW
ncbi:MAG: isoprenylcysteine carboxylmethyltransferase family protein [Promethearchaeota archaeon]